MRTTSFYPFPTSPGSFHWLLGLMLVGLGHGLAMAWLASGPVRSAVVPPPPKVHVRLLERLPQPPSQPRMEPPPLPVPLVTPLPRPAPRPMPVARPTRQSPIPPVPVATPAAVAEPVVEARHDAAYLQNPKPVYPLLSRRLGETGRVVVRAEVSAEGETRSVTIAQSSGFDRLDEAALQAVRQWRFVPARQGNREVAATVLVPLHFNLDR